MTKICFDVDKFSEFLKRISTKDFDIILDLNKMRISKTNFLTNILTGQRSSEWGEDFVLEGVVLDI